MTELWTDIQLYFSENLGKYLTCVRVHVGISFLALLTAAVIGIPLGYMCVKNQRWNRLITGGFQVLRIIPSLALFALLIPVTGLGMPTAVIVLTVYNQYLLLRNFVAGLFCVDPAVTEAAEGLGMSRMQVLVRIRIPLAKKALFTGIQLSIVSTIGIATIAAMINAGGLGTILFDGLRTLNVNKIVCGSVLSAGLALGINGCFQAVEKRL